jgi:hypothetical protein
MSAIWQLLHALSRHLQFSVGRLLILLDECVQHDNPTSHDETVESAADSRPAAWSKFEESVAKGA